MSSTNKSSDPRLPSVHVVIPTHTDRHLRRTLLGLARQDVMPSTVTISCDTNDASIARVVEDIHTETAMPMTLVSRARHEQPRRAQTRNNGLRALLASSTSPNDMVLFLDGDCLPAPDLVQVHATSAHKGDLVIGYFVPLDEETTAALEESSLALSLPPEQRTLLKQRQRRARRQLFLRRLGLTKSHKPKAVTGNLSVRLERISEVNGFDEAYMEWGFEDDDFARRLHATGARSVLAHAEALVYHQWHPSLKSGDWTHTSSARRFRTSTPKRCVRGLDHPIEQHTVSTMRFGC